MSVTTLVPKTGAERETQWTAIREAFRAGYSQRAVLTSDPDGLASQYAERMVLPVPTRPKVVPIGVFNIWFTQNSYWYNRQDGGEAVQCDCAFDALPVTPTNEEMRKVLALEFDANEPVPVPVSEWSPRACVRVFDAVNATTFGNYQTASEKVAVVRAARPEAGVFDQVPAPDEAQQVVFEGCRKLPRQAPSL